MKASRLTTLLLILLLSAMVREVADRVRETVLTSIQQVQETDFGKDVAVFLTEY